SLQLQPGPNPREYVNDGPTNATDPSGQFLVATSEAAAREMLWVLYKKWDINPQQGIFRLDSGRYYIPVRFEDWTRLRGLHAKETDGWYGSVLRAASSAESNLEVSGGEGGSTPRIQWTRDTGARFPEEMRGHADARGLTAGELRQIEKELYADTSVK